MTFLLTTHCMENRERINLNSHFRENRAALRGTAVIYKIINKRMRCGDARILPGIEKEHSLGVTNVSPPVFRGLWFPSSKVRWHLPLLLLHDRLEQNNVWTGTPLALWPLKQFSQFFYSFSFFLSPFLACTKTSSHKLWEDIILLKKLCLQQ